MADNFFKVSKGINLKGSASAPANPQAGDIYYNTVDSAFKVYDGASWKEITLNNATQILIQKDIDGGTASNASRITVPKDTKANLDLLNRKEGSIVWATDEKKFYLDNGTDLVRVDVGISGVALVGGGTLTHLGTSLSFTEDLFVQVPGMENNRNRIPATVSPINFNQDDIVSVTYNSRDPGSAADIDGSIINEQPAAFTEGIDKFIIFRSVGPDIFIGNSFDKIKLNRSTEIGVGGAINSVNGQTGVVVLDTDDIAEGSTNEYYTEAKVSANTSVVANTAKISADGSITTHSDVGGAPPVDGQVLTWINLNSRYEPQAPVTSRTVPIGSIVAYNPGYFTDSANGGFTLSGPATNDAAGVNTFLNIDGWYVCNGDAPNEPSSPIWNDALRRVPNLTSDRFLMGASAAGNTGGANSVSLTAANIPTISITGSTSASNTDPIGDHTHVFTHDHAAINTGTVSSNHYHSINHDHAAVNTGTVSSGHSHAGPANPSEGASPSALNAGSTGWTLKGTGGGGGPQTSGISANHVHGVDLPNYSGNSGWISANHTHSVDIPSLSANTDSGGSHSHTVPSTSVSGSYTNNSLASVSIMPNYLTCFYIIRVF